MDIRLDDTAGALLGGMMFFKLKARFLILDGDQEFVLFANEVRRRLNRWMRP